MFITQFIPFIPGFEQACKAHKAVTFKFPLEKNSSEYRKYIKTNSLPDLRRSLQPLFDEFKIRKDVLIIQENTEHFCCALGTNFGKGDAVIAISPNFYQTDPQACSWVSKHEISHIRHNDLFFIPLVTSICSIAAAMFFLSNLTKNSSIKLMFLKTLAIQSAAYALFSQYRERQADTFAIANSNAEELEGARRFLVATQLANSEQRTNSWMRFLYSSSGECRLDVLHPSYKSRLRKIESALKKHGNELTNIDYERVLLLKKIKQEAETQVDKAEQDNVKSSYKLGPFTFTKS